MTVRSTRPREAACALGWLGTTMRIGIDYRILAVGRAWLNRGMGRFTQQQLSAMLSHGSPHEYVLICAPGADISLIKPEVLGAENVTIEYCPDSPEGSGADKDSLLRRAEEFQGWVHRQRLDLFHATTPLLLAEPSLALFDACPLVSTFYDAIPLVFPRHYLEGWASYDHFARTFAMLRRSHRLIAISESARRDAAVYLGFPRERIDVVYPVPDDRFRVLPGEHVARDLHTLRQRCPVPERYFLTVTHIHHAKNLQTLLRAYSLLPVALRAEVPLVVCCHLDEHGIGFVRRLAEEMDIADEVMVTGLVSDAELTALYNGATVVVHPSRYEGFGLPVVEAMRCGAPVITTTASSLPEAGGDAACLVDAEDPYQFADAMSELVGDSVRRADMRDRGLAHTAKFDDAQLASGTLGAYDAAVGLHVSPSPPRMRIALWTPLPPQQTGIADYSAELLPCLDAECDVEVFVDDGYLPSLDLLQRYRIHHHGAFDRRNQQAPFDAVLYQMGGSLFHLYMYEALRRHPGVVVFHDLIWSNVLYTDSIHHGDVSRFEREARALEGDAAVHDLQKLRERAPSQDAKTTEEALWQYLAKYPMLHRIVDNSIAQVVPFEAAAIELRERHANANPHVVPMGVVDPCGARPKAEALAARARLRLRAGTFVVGAFGIVHPFKRLESCVEAIAGVVAEHPDTVFVMVGRSLDPGYENRLLDLAVSFGVSRNVRLVGHTSRRDFDAYLLACDVVLNLRYPFLRQMSATLMRAIAAGKPVLVSDHPDWQFIPREFCVRVPPDEREVECITTHLRRLAADESGRKVMSARARLYFKEEATITHMSERYVRLLHEVAVSHHLDSAAGMQDRSA